MERGGLASELAARGVAAGGAVGFADEMRVGLRGATRRVWGVRGVKVRQLVQLVYEWRYLALAVDGRAGAVWWTWNETMRAPETWVTVEAIREQAGLAALVWDRAKGHQDAAVRAAGLPLVEQPPYSPELNPAERIFEYLRGKIEGVVYPSLDAKAAAVDAVLEALDADPARVTSLAGWRWIDDNLGRLPAQDAA